MMNGETVLSGAQAPDTEMTILRTGAGFYVGYVDQDGLPYSRESGYFATEYEAEEALSRIEKALTFGKDPRKLSFVR